MRMLSAIGISHEELADDDRRFDVAVLDRFLLQLPELIKDPEEWLGLWNRLPTEVWLASGPVAALFRSSRCLRDAWKQYARYQPLVVSDSDFVFRELPGRATIALEHLRFSSALRDRHFAWAMAAAVVATNRLLGERMPPLEATFVHSVPATTRGYERIFGKRLAFSAATYSVSYPSEVLSRPLVSAAEHTIAALEARLMRALETIPQQPETSKRVRYEILAALQDGKPTRHAVAKACGMSTRTLQRRLDDEHTTFAVLLDDVRSLLARELLQTLPVSSAQVATMVGFTAAPAFHRSFVRWTGLSPKQFRLAARRA